MKIAIFSDTHIGFGKGSARETEAFDQAKEAFELALKEKADLVLLAGDLFNEAVPTQEDWLQMFRLFSVPRQEEREKIKVLYEKGSEKKEFSFDTVPIISIAGTHEFRSKDYKNALEVLQEAGCLVFLHAAKASFELDGEKVVVHGLSGVPEKKALDVLNMWNPRPEQGAANIMLLHQSIKEFLPFDDDMVATIALPDLPNGFDLIVDGHLHWPSDKNLETKRLLVTGSTVVTQMKKLEASKPKGVFFFDTATRKVDFLPLPKQRQFLFEKLEFKDASLEQVRLEAEKRLDELLANVGGMPLVKLKLKGTLARGLASSDIDLRALSQKHVGSAIVFIDQDFEETGFRQKLEQLREAQSGKKSVSSMGLEILEKNLAETGFKDGFDVKRIFDLLSEGDIDKVVSLLSEVNGKQC